MSAGRTNPADTRQPPPAPHRRLAAVGSHVGPTLTGSAAPHPADEEVSLLAKYDANLRPEPYTIPEAMDAQAPVQRLTDAAVQRFIVDGFITVPSLRTTPSPATTATT